MLVWRIVIICLIFKKNTVYWLFDNWFWAKNIHWQENALSQHSQLTTLKNLFLCITVVTSSQSGLYSAWHLYRSYESMSRCICWHQDQESVWVNTWVRQAGSAPTGNVVIPLPSLPASNCSYTPINTLDITDSVSHWSGSWLTCNPGSS